MRYPTPVEAPEAYAEKPGTCWTCGDATTVALPESFGVPVSWQRACTCAVEASVLTGPMIPRGTWVRMSLTEGIEMVDYVEPRLQRHPEGLVTFSA